MNLSPSTPIPRREEIEVDKILIVHSNSPVILIGNLLCILPLANVLWFEWQSISIFIWIGAVCLLTFVRWLHIRTLDLDTATVERILLQGKIYTIFALLAGLVWGSAGAVFFYQGSVEIFPALILTLMAIVGASMSSLSSRPTTHVAFAIPTMAPIVISMFLSDIAYYYWYGVGSLVYLGVTFVFSRNMFVMVNESLALKYENIDLVRDLEKQTDAANKANQDKSTFLASASHDLRQPLHAINLFVETLGYQITTEAQRTNLGHIHQGLESLSELLNALLDVSQLDAETASANKSNLQLGELILKWTAHFSVAASEKQLKMTVENCEHTIHSDPILLGRLFTNLLSNAIRYTQRGSIKIFCTTNNDNTLTIHITDTGQGIPKNEYKRIFDEFVQLDNPERDRSKGLGLGLSIVGRISELLDHPVNFQSEEGVGTDFTIEIPLGVKTEKPKQLVAQSSANNKLEGKQVLVIDNELEILEAMKGILTMWGSRFTGAESVPAALELIAGGLRPQLVIADYRLPGDINGCELATLIRQELGDVPVVIVTGNSEEEVHNEISAANFVMLTKPIKPAQLRITLTRLVS